MMKMQILSTLMVLSVSALLTACQTPDSAETAADPTAAETAESIPAQETAAETESTSAETAAEEETIPAVENMSFTVDITDNHAAEMGLVIGNTATKDNYCGMIEIHLDEALAEKAAQEIQIGKTYLFTVQPMMTMSIPPQVAALDFTPADDQEIAKLEEIRKTVSNYTECMETYQDMELEQIIQDANMNYALWTQEEIAEFTEFIAQKGYTDDFKVKSYVKIREELSGSIAGFSED